MINQSNGRTRAIGHDAPARRRRGGVILLAIAAAVFLGGGTLVSYYVDALWFDSLGYAAVFWTRIELQAVTFAVFAALTFVAIYGAFLTLKPARFDELIGEVELRTVYVDASAAPRGLATQRQCDRRMAKLHHPDYEAGPDGFRAHGPLGDRLGRPAGERP